MQIELPIAPRSEGPLQSQTVLGSNIPSIKGPKETPTPLLLGMDLRPGGSSFGVDSSAVEGSATTTPDKNDRRWGSGSLLGPLLSEVVGFRA